MSRIPVRRQVYSDDYMSRKFDLRTSNCWHLVRDVWRDMTGDDLGDLTPENVDTAALGTAMTRAAASPRFDRLARPEVPCIVLMHRRGQTPHVGVLLRWKVLHIRPSGVQHQWLSDVELEFDRVEYFLPVGAA